MVAASGDPLLAESAVEALRSRLMPLAAVVTPNLPEAAFITSRPIARDEEEMAAQGRLILGFGAALALVKGGHGDGPESVDLLVSGSECGATPWRASPRGTCMAPAARCPRPSRRGSRKGEDCRRPWPRPRPMSRPPSRLRHASPSGGAMGRRIISTPGGGEARIEASRCPVAGCDHIRSSTICRIARRWCVKAMCRRPSGVWWTDG